MSICLSLVRSLYSGEVQLTLDEEHSGDTQRFEIDRTTRKDGYDNGKNHYAAIHYVGWSHAGAWRSL